MINFIIQVVLFQALFLVVYDVFLKRETFFVWNRKYLLLTPIVSLIIPLIELSGFQKQISNEFIVQLPEVVINPEILIENTAGPSILQLLPIVILTGIVIFGGLYLLRLRRLLSIIKTQKTIEKRQYTLVLIDDKRSPFSFFNYIFLPKNFIGKASDSVLKHELVHVQQGHSWDLLLFELLKILFWFNPLNKLYQQRISLVHEYISDAVIAGNSDRSAYCNQLLSTTFKVENVSFVNPFFKHSFIKKRIIMITKDRSKKLNRLKYLLLVPLLLGMLIYSSCEEASEKEQLDVEVQQIEEQNANKMDAHSNGETVVAYGEKSFTETTKDVPFAIVEKPPQFPGCEGDAQELKKCLQASISNHVGRNFNADLSKTLKLESGVHKINVMFRIDKEGNIVDIKARASHIKMAEEAIRVIESLPNLIPGEQRGEKVSIQYALPIKFKIE